MRDTFEGESERRSNGSTNCSHNKINRIGSAMRMLATPLLEPPPGDSTPFALENLQPRQFVDLLDQHKALIFKSAGPEPFTTDDFGDLVANLQLEYYPYIGGAAPRTIIPVKAGGDIVFTANERYDPP
jgi:hypothetical protein